MKQDFKSKKWTSCAILSSALNDVKNICKNTDGDFANPSQFISYAVRKELDRLKEK